MKDFISSMREKVLLYDGSKGVMLQMRGLKGEEAAESWNLIKPDEVKNVYNLYRQAGSDVLQTNTFPGNRIILDGHSLGDKTYQINYEGVKLAREVADDSKYVAASIGPTGLFFEPAGELTFDKAYDIFNEQLRAIEDAGADAVNFETFTDINELRAAILAAKENTKLPIIASMTFNIGGKTLSGNPAEVCAIISQSLGAEVVGANCSGGPENLLEPIRRMYSVAAVPLSVKANAGMPELIDGCAVFKETPEKFSSYTKEFVENGVRLIGGCCGTTPDFIRAIRKELDKIKTSDLQLKFDLTIASPYNYITLSSDKKYSVQSLLLEEHHLQEALKNRDYDVIIDSVLDCEAEGCDCFLVDFGNMDASFDMWGFVSTFGISVRRPVIIKSESVEILEKFLRYYPGRAGVVVSDTAKISVSKLEHYGALAVDLELKPLR